MFGDEMIDINSWKPEIKDSLEIPYRNLKIPNQ